LRQLHKHNIIKLFNVFEDEKYIFLIIELIERGEIDALIAQKFKDNDAKEVVNILIDSIRYWH
jgi:serine/threonine protein kinase